MKIASIDAYPIFDSRGNPTVEAEVTLAGGAVGHGLVPCGASTGQFEAWELRDGGRRWRGKGVDRAVSHIRGEIAARLVGHSAAEQVEVDETLMALDGTPNKSRLGANAILAVSMAVADAAARANRTPLFEFLGAGRGDLLPLPEIQIIGGGAHADWRTDIQDFLVIATGAADYRSALEITFDIYHAAGEVLKERGRYCGLADEGGYWPQLETNEAALDLLLESMERAGYTPGVEASLSLDIAASDLFDADSQTYRFGLENRSFSKQEFADLIVGWCDKYPIISIEDPAADEDWPTWQRIFEAVGQRVQVVGDDLFTTNIKRIRTGVDRGVANSVLIKLNQIGTVSETLQAIQFTQQAGWLPLISARSGETEDAFISHLAVATNAGQLKVGSFARSERMVKWNECLRIERALGARARFIGAKLYETIRA
jgi:enolase